MTNETVTNVNKKINIVNKIDEANQNLEFQTLDNQIDKKMKSVLCVRLIKIINFQ